MTKKTTITVEAVGTASAPPDVARVRLFSFAEDPAPGDALTSCSLLTERVLAALREAGVAASDLETTSIELNEYQRREDSVAGFRASIGLAATVRPPQDAGRIVAAAVEAAGTGVGIQNVSFDLDDRAPLVSLARRDAVERALGAARELAEAAGLMLGPLLELAEGGGARTRFAQGGHFKMARRLSAASPPVEIGELGESVTVTATFEVERPVTG